MYHWRGKARMIICACAWWSESAHIAHVRRHFYAWRGSYNVQRDKRPLMSYANSTVPKTSLCIASPKITITTDSLRGHRRHWSTLRMRWLIGSFVNIIWTASSEKVPSSMLKMRGFNSCECRPGLWSPFIHSVVTEDSAGGQWRPWSDCAYAQSDLGLRCPHLPEDTFLYSAWVFLFLFFFPFCFFFFFFFFFFRIVHQPITVPRFSHKCCFISKGSYKESKFCINCRSAHAFSTYIKKKKKKKNDSPHNNTSATNCLKCL